MKNFEMIEQLLNRENGPFSKEEIQLLKSNEWLSILWLKETTDDINIENYEKIDHIHVHSTLEYVYRTLKILEEEDVTEKEFAILEEVLSWCEVSKGGTKAMRETWKKSISTLSIHNIASSILYQQKHEDLDPDTLHYITTLIATHGLIGQYLRGETALRRSEPLTLVSLPNIRHKKVIQVLNKCIIAAKSKELYVSLEQDINLAIDELLDHNRARLKKLRKAAIQNGEDFDAEYEKFLELYPESTSALNSFLSRFDFWYIEAATKDFRLCDTLKLFVYIAKHIDTNITDLSFGKMMSFYCDLQGKKVINLFKERIIESLLNNYDITSDQELQNEHVKIQFVYEGDMAHVLFEFSPIAQKFIDFCITATGQGALYDQVITLACDYFQIRRDRYDRFYNEASYLQTMNSTTKFKTVLVDYITGEKIIDVGPGGGGLMDAILDRYPKKHVTGIDVSENVIEKLRHIKGAYGKKWDVMAGDALNLSHFFKKGDFDTIIFCSILHELYSYIEYDGQKFNKDTLKQVFRSVYELLPQGGRLIIRDGIMTDSQEKRVIRFKDANDIKILQRYCNDFQGRKITYQPFPSDPNAVIMNINDAMEFLYTYTWGEESYAHEINEQFGYFTPNEYVQFVCDCFEGNCKVINMDYYLQEGYAENLLPKIDFLDESGKMDLALPASTFILVVEKI